jgi:hypothetical protein
LIQALPARRNHRAKGREQKQREKFSRRLVHPFRADDTWKHGVIYSNPVELSKPLRSFVLDDQQRNGLSGQCELQFHPAGLHGNLFRRLQFRKLPGLLQFRELFF